MPKMSPEEEQLYNYHFGVAPYDTPEGRAAAPQWLRDTVRDSAPQSTVGSGPSASSTRGPGQRFLANWSPWGIGTFALGIAMVIAAIALHDHYALPNAICRTSLGQFGQAFSGTAYYDCSAAATAEGAVGWLVVLGVGALLVGGGKMLLALVGAAALTRQEVSSATAKVPQPGAQPAAVPDGASRQTGTGEPRLFCTRCGTRAATGDRYCGECGAPVNSAVRT